MHNPVEQSKGREQACVDRMRLLPTELPPPFNWQEFQRRAREGLPAESPRLDWRHVAAAAVLLVVVCGIAVWGRVGSIGRQVAGQAAVRTGVDTGMGSRAGAYGEVGSGIAADSRAAPGAGAGGQADEAALAAIRSHALESWLATLPREPVVVHVGTRAAVARLEDRIAQVDDLLTSVRLDGMRPDRLAALQRERVQLVGSLAQVRYAEVVASELP